MTALLCMAVVSGCGSYKPKEDVIECGLPDGSKFILKAKFLEWDGTIFDVMNWHGAQRINQGNFAAWYVDKEASEARLARPSAVPYEMFKVDPTGRTACKELGKKGNAFVFDTFLNIRHGQFQDLLIPNKVRPVGWVSEASSELERQFRQKFEDMELKPSINAIVQHGNVLTLETALRDGSGECREKEWDSQCVVKSVLKYTSSDNGKTWEGPIITTDAEVFELGRSVHEQSFIARPIRINGKEVQPYFPLPPADTFQPPSPN